MLAVSLTGFDPEQTPCLTMACAERAFMIAARHGPCVCRSAATGATTCARYAFVSVGNVWRCAGRAAGL